MNSLLLMHGIEKVLAVPLLAHLSVTQNRALNASQAHGRDIIVSLHNLPALRALVRSAFCFFLGTLVLAGVAVYFQVSRAPQLDQAVWL